MKCVIACLLGLALGIPAGGGTGTARQLLDAAVHPAGSITVPPTAALVSSAAQFQPYAGSITLNYRARTSAGGGGSITFGVTSDFSPAGGPSVAAGKLTYTCSGATLGTPCSGSQTASTAFETPVVSLPAGACTGGGGACSKQNPNSVILNFELANDPAYATGLYSAKITFVISAT